MHEKSTLEWYIGERNNQDMNVSMMVAIYGDDLLFRARMKSLEVITVVCNNERMEEASHELPCVGQTASCSLLISYVHRRTDCLEVCLAPKA